MVKNCALLTALAASLLSAVSAQQPTCDFRMTGVYYTCRLTIFNYQGLDNFTAIAGTHLEGKSDSDVTGLNLLDGATAVVPQILCRQFGNLRVVDFSNAGIERVTESSFGECRELEWLRLWNNRLGDVAARTFERNSKLAYLDLDGNSLTTLPEHVFANLTLLEWLDLPNNPFVDLPSGVFRSLRNLRWLDLSNCNIATLDAAWFATLENLEGLFLVFNTFSVIDADKFAALRNLRTLDLSHVLSPTGILFIHPQAFSALGRLETLDMTDMQLTEIDARWFAATTALIEVYFNFNAIDSLPARTFERVATLASANFWSNRLRVVRRSSFGNVADLRMLDLDSNNVQALDRALIEDAVGLFTVYFDFNVCASLTMENFLLFREQFVQELAGCFVNAENGADLVTPASTAYNFLPASLSGIDVQVSSSSTPIQIALTPFDFAWTPMLEVIIGAANNTRSVIRRNRETDVVTVPTPGILRAGQWNGFRISWANHAVLVFREGDEWPFMGFTMADFFPVNFYGLRSPDDRASWFILPVE